MRFRNALAHLSLGGMLGLGQAQIPAKQVEPRRKEYHSAAVLVLPSFVGLVLASSGVASAATFNEELDLSMATISNGRQLVIPIDTIFFNLAQSNTFNFTFKDSQTIQAEVASPPSDDLLVSVHTGCAACELAVQDLDLDDFYDGRMQVELFDGGLSIGSGVDFFGSAAGGFSGNPGDPGVGLPFVALDASSDLTPPNPMPELDEIQVVIDPFPFPYNGFDFGELDLLTITVRSGGTIAVGGLSVETDLTFTGALGVDPTDFLDVNNWEGTFDLTPASLPPESVTNIYFDATAGVNTNVTLPTFGGSALTMDIRDQAFTFSASGPPSAPLRVGELAGNFDGVVIESSGELICSTNCHIQVENLDGFGVTEIAATGALTINGGVYETVELNNTAGGDITVNGGELNMGVLGMDLVGTPSTQFLIAGGGTVTSDGFLDVTSTEIEVSNGTLIADGSFSLKEGSALLIGPNGRFEGGFGLFESTFTLDGGTAVLDGAFLNSVPDGGPSSFSVINGGVIEDNAAQWIIAGDSTPSSALISGPGSSYTSLTNQVQVGAGHNGTLLIENGGSLFTSGASSPSGSSGLIGNGGAGSGAVTVTGDGSQWTQDGGLSVGFSALGTLDVLDSGFVQSLDGFIGRNPGGDGNASVGASSTWTVTQSLYVGGNATGSGGVGVLTLAGGTVTAGSDVRIWETGQLNGSGSITAHVKNRGLVAPGFSPGIIMIDGDYTQDAGGTLEIEIADTTTPGTDYDQLQVTGTATLGGRLDVPLIDGYVPSLNDEVIAITAATVSGEFNLISSPDLGGSGTGLAIDVIENNTDVRIRFVTPDTSIQFVRTDPGTLDWSDPLNWTGGAVPDTPNNVALGILAAAGVQGVDVPTAEDSFANQVAVSGAAGQEFTLRVQGNLSAVSGLAGGDNGTVELDGGRIAAYQVTMNNGSRLTGIGEVIADVQIGSGSGEAMLSPGLAGVGNIDIDGNYEQMTGGTLEIEIEDGGSDTLEISGQATLGGKLMIDATNLTLPAPGTTFQIITAGGLDAADIFDSIETVGNDDIYFVPVYSATSGALGGDAPLAALTTGAGVSVAVFQEGDMTGDAIFDQEDVNAFALALTDPLEYFNQYFIFGDQSGDIDDDGDIDFDDIDNFAALIPGMSTTQVLAAIRGMPEQVPEPGTWPLLLVGMPFLLKISRLKPIH